MKFTFSVFSISLLFGLLPDVFAVKAQIPKESALISHLVKKANQPDAHSAGDVYLAVTIGPTEYIAELASGKVISQRKAESASGGFCSTYAEVAINLLASDKKATTQGAGQLLQLSKGKWKLIALSEGDYACEKLKRIPKSVITCLKIECN